MFENKQVIATLLCRTLKSTRGYCDIDKILVSDDEEYATVLFDNGGKKVVCIAMDSGEAMIRDILNALH